MHIFTSLQAREQLIESLNQRIEEASSDSHQQLQLWKDELEQQQFADIDLYKDTLSVTNSLQDPLDADVDTDDVQTGFMNQDSWDRNFADGFIAHLTAEDSPLIPLWFGERYSYPTYIGFDIRRLGNRFDFDAMNACWLAANLWSRQIYAGLHFKNPLYYQELEAGQAQINREFSQAFNGRHLEWNPHVGPAGIYRIRLLVDVDNNRDQPTLFENLDKALQALDTVFKPRIENMLN